MAYSEIYANIEALDEYNKSAATIIDEIVADTEIMNRYMTEAGAMWDDNIYSEVFNQYVGMVNTLKALLHVIDSNRNILEHHIQALRDYAAV